MYNTYYFFGISKYFTKKISLFIRGLVLLYDHLAFWVSRIFLSLVYANILPFLIKILSWWSNSECVHHIGGKAISPFSQADPSKFQHIWQHILLLQVMYQSYFTCSLFLCFALKSESRRQGEVLGSSSRELQNCSWLLQDSLAAVKHQF